MCVQCINVEDYLLQGLNLIIRQYFSLGKKIQLWKVIALLLLRKLFPMRPERATEGRRECGDTRMCK